MTQLPHLTALRGKDAVQLRQILLAMEQRIAEVEGVTSGGTFLVSGGEFFIYVVDDPTVAAGANRDVALAYGDGAWHNSVSLASDTISLPEGTWTMGATVTVDGAPTSGELSLRWSDATVFDLQQYIGFVDYADVASYAIAPTISGALMVHQTESFDATLGVYNAFDTSASLYGTVWGHRLPTASSGSALGSLPADLMAAQENDGADIIASIGDGDYTNRVTGAAMDTSNATINPNADVANGFPLAILNGYINAAYPSSEFCPYTYEFVVKIPSAFPEQDLGGTNYTANVPVRTWGPSVYTDASGYFSGYQKHKYSGTTYSVSVQHPVNIADDTLHHLCCTVSGSGEYTIYLDGVQVDQATATYGGNLRESLSHHVRIGYSLAGGASSANGLKIGNFAHYDHVLTSSQVLTHAQLAGLA